MTGNWPPADRTTRERYAARVRGCLLGGAIGDALGAPVEFWSASQIRAGAGPDGVREYLPIDDGEGPLHGRITDDTQMTLFTVEGLIRASIRQDRGIGFTVGVVHSAYDRWLDTQLLPGPPSGAPTGWLAQQRWLYARRAPGTTCLDALGSARGGALRIPQYGHPAVNDSKGCGGVMRSAPFGLLPPVWSRRRIFDLAAEAAGYTHGHPTGKLASGAFAAVVAGLVAGDDLATAVDAALAILAEHDGHEETSAALAAARELGPGAGDLDRLGEGWVAEEALAMGVAAALAFPGPDQVLDALALAVSHGGDSDSTGSICGNLLGAWHGDSALPAVLAFEVEGRGTILQLADDLVWELTVPRQLHGDHGPRTRWTDRY